MDEADHVIEGEIYIGAQEHFYMEPHSVMVVPKGEDGELEIFCSTQHAAFVQVKGPFMNYTLGVSNHQGNKIKLFLGKTRFLALLWMGIKKNIPILTIFYETHFYESIACICLSPMFKRI